MRENSLNKLVRSLWVSHLLVVLFQQANWDQRHQLQEQNTEVLVAKILLNLVSITKNNSEQVLTILIQKLKVQHHLLLQAQRNQKLKRKLILIQKKILLTQILTLTVMTHKNRKKSRKNNRKKNFKNKKKPKKKKMSKYQLLKVYQWHRKLQGLSSLLS